MTSAADNIRVFALTEAKALRFGSGSKPGSQGRAVHGCSFFTRQGNKRAVYPVFVSGIMQLELLMSATPALPILWSCQ
jgi:hypothetical protein